MLPAQRTVDSMIEEKSVRYWLCILQDSDYLFYYNKRPTLDDPSPLTGCKGCLFCGSVPFHPLAVRGRAAWQRGGPHDRHHLPVRGQATGTSSVIRHGGLLHSACKMAAQAHVLPTKSGGSPNKLGSSLSISISNWFMLCCKQILCYGFVGTF